MKYKCFVFPTKRACYVFRKELTRTLNENFILPEIVTIKELVSNLSGKEAGDEIVLVSKLYEAYSSVFKVNETYTFDKFYAYGKQLLKEFDEIDRYILHADKVFSYVEQLEKLESYVDLNEKKLQFLKDFWTSYHQNDKENHGVKETFTNEWKLLSQVYSKYNSLLELDNLWYEGAIYRNITINIEQKSLKKYSEIHFCGFNALSISEIRLIKALVKESEVKLFFDSDKYYLDNGNHLAGFFLRQNLERFHPGNIKLIESNSTLHERNLHLIECKSDINQLSFLAETLNGTGKEVVAVVLNDESLLPGLFQFDIRDWSNVNISMGYPLGKTQTFRLFEELRTIFLTMKSSGKRVYLYKKYLLNLLNNELIASYFGESFSYLVDIISHNGLVYLSSEMLKEADLEKLYVLFNEPDKLYSIIFDLLIEISAKRKCSHLEQIALQMTLDRLIDVKSRMDIQQICSGDPVTILHFLKEILTGIKLTFDTNPDAQIQIMGLLETRVLDYEKIIMLSCNDEFLPGNNQNNFSFIPYLVRKAYDLPTGDEHNAIFSYHFFRLLQRAKDITLMYVYNETTYDKEESRFIRQLKSNLHLFKNTHATYTTLSVKNQPAEKVPVENIKKTSHVLTSLEKYASGEKAFSPTSVSIYIQNPFLFALKYGFKINEPDVDTEEVDHLIFGQILHKCIEKIYLPYVGKMLDNGDVEALGKTPFLEKITEETFAEYNVINDIHLVGVKNKILEESIVSILKEILSNDMERTPFRIIGLEESIEIALKGSNGKSYKLKGTIDRIDEMKMEGQKTIQIIDYKTGRTDIKALDNNKILPKTFIPDGKYYFQGLFYGLLLTENHMNYDNMEVYFYGVRNKAYLPISTDSIKEALIEAFKEKLMEIIEEILNPEVDFIMNPKDKYRAGSAYAGLMP